MPAKILIVDDEEDTRVYLETLFRKAGYETATASDGEEAMRLVTASLPDLITLDILMPRQSGLTFFELIRDKEGFQDVPIIVLSGVTRHRDFFDPADRIGQTLFVDKPIDPDDLLEKVRQLLRE